MNTKLILLIGLLLLFSLTPIYATPVINKVKFIPSDIWLTENTVINVECFDNENKSISEVFTDIQGPDIILPRIRLTAENLTTYNATISSSYLDRVGIFNANVYCINSENQNTTASASFTVSTLSAIITSITPDPVYIGEPLTINYLVKKNNVALSSDVTFNIKLNGVSYSLKQDPAFDTVKGWVLVIDSPLTSGTYIATVTAFHNRNNITNSASVVVKRPISFDVVSLDKTELLGNDSIVITVEALEKGAAIDLKADYLDIKINSTGISILDITRINNRHTVKVSVPALLPRTYSMEIIFSYKTYSAAITKTVSYVIPVSGKIVDESGNGIKAKLKFISDLGEKTIETDSTGSYSGVIVPREHDIEIIFPESELKLFDVMIDEFEDPICYQALQNIETPGLWTSRIYVFEVDLQFSKVFMQLSYDDKTVFDESQLSLYRCDNWNVGNKVCNVDWVRVAAEIDSVRNLIKLNKSSLSAYAIGEEKRIKVDYGLDKAIYNLNDVIKIKGITQDDNNKEVGNVNLTIGILGTEISQKTVSDDNGIFELELLAPDSEGTYELSIKAEKLPYLSFEETESIEIVKSKELSVVAPDIIKITQGDNATSEIIIVNVGQTDLFDVKISLTGFPEDYYTLGESIAQISAGQESRVTLQLDIPENASKNTYSVNLEVSADNITVEKIFAITIIEKIEKEEQLPTGEIILPRISLPQVGFEWIFLILLSISSLFIAFVLKRRKISKKEDKAVVGDYLEEIKRGLVEPKKKRKR